jgi:hypothetical protein
MPRRPGRAAALRNSSSSALRIEGSAAAGLSAVAMAGKAPLPFPAVAASPRIVGCAGDGCAGRVAAASLGVAAAVAALLGDAGFAAALAVFAAALAGDDLPPPPPLAPFLACVWSARHSVSNRAWRRQSRRT